MKQSINDIVMDKIIGLLYDHMIHQDKEDQTIGEIDRYMNCKYTEDVIQLFYKNSGYQKISKMIKEA